jgi:hypothetical protein
MYNNETIYNKKASVLKTKKKFTFSNFTIKGKM